MILLSDLFGDGEGISDPSQGGIPVISNDIGEKIQVTLLESPGVRFRK